MLKLHRPNRSMEKVVCEIVHVHKGCGFQVSVIRANHYRCVILLAYIREDHQDFLVFRTNAAETLNLYSEPWVNHFCKYQCLMRVGVS